MGGADAGFQERVARLRALDLFASLDDARLDRLARTLVDLRYPAGAGIIREGQEADYFYVVLAGEVEIVRGTRLIAVRRSGDYFGDAALRQHTPQTANAIARTAVSLYALDGSTFLEAAVFRGLAL